MRRREPQTCEYSRSGSPAQPAVALFDDFFMKGTPSRTVGGPDLSFFPFSSIKVMCEYCL